MAVVFYATTKRLVFSLIMNYAPVLPRIKLRVNFTTEKLIDTPNMTKQKIATGVSCPLVAPSGVVHTSVVKPLKNSLANSVISPKPLEIALIISAPICYVAPF